MRCAASSRQSFRLAVIFARGERFINPPEHLRGAIVAGAHHNAVGVEKILNRRAFAQEFGV